MRKSLLEQLSLTPVPIAHVHATELAAIGLLLDRLPKAVALVHDDLSVRHGRRVDPTKGRDGMAAEQLLRAAVLKQHTGLSYERLAFALADSSTYRSFCRIGYEQKPPTKSALQRTSNECLSPPGKRSIRWSLAKLGTSASRRARKCGQIAWWWNPTSITRRTPLCFGTACACSPES